jgi:signal transduction histidine kinase
LILLTHNIQNVTCHTLDPERNINSPKSIQFQVNKMALPDKSGNRIQVAHSAQLASQSVMPDTRLDSYGTIPAQSQESNLYNTDLDPSLPANYYFRIIFDKIDEGILLVSSDGKILTHNSVVTGYINPDILKSGEFHIHDTHLSLFRPDCKIYSSNEIELHPEDYVYLNSVRRCLPVQNRELKLRWPDGRTIWLLLSIIPLNNIKGENDKLLIIFNDITEQKRMQQETESYVREITRIQEEERRRISRELHDDTAQSLAYLSLELDSLIHSHESTLDKISIRLKDLKSQVDHCLQEVRRFSHELRSGVLDQLGLIAALEAMVDEINARHQIQIKFDVTGHERRLNNEEELALFRIAQEALNNVRKHSQATHATLSIKYRKKGVRLAVADNGRGFRLSEIDNAITRGRLGLIGMRERVRLIGGTLSIKSDINNGTTIVVELKKENLLDNTVG